MTTATRADICAVACAEAFRGDGEILASPMGTMPALGARLARLTFEPDLLLSDGEATLLADTPPLGASLGDVATEGWLPYRHIFDLVWSGRRHVMMGAAQLDRYGNQNIACIGPWQRPKAQLLGVRGAPGNTICHPTSYWVPNHSPRVFVEAVDVVCGVGYDRAAALGERASRFHEIRVVVTSLAVLDFATPDHRMRLRSVHPGVNPADVQAATGFELVLPADVPETRLPTPDELRLLRTLDPDGLAAREVPGMTAPAPDLAAAPAARRSPLHTRACDLFGVDLPIVQTGMGWVSGARLTAATAEAGGLGILASATMTFDELAGAIRKVKERTDKPFGVNFRADQEDIDARVDLAIREGVRVASFAQAPGERVIKRLKDAGLVVMPTIGKRRHAEKVQQWGVDAVIAQGHEGGGHTGPVPTSLLLPDVVDAVDIPVIAAGGYRDGRGLVAALAMGASGIAMGTRFLLTQESQVPDNIKARYLAAKVTDTVVSYAVDGYPQRVVRTELVDALERSGWLAKLWRSLRNALRFRKETGATFGGLLREGLETRKKAELTWPQVIMAANAPMMTKLSLVDGRDDSGVLPTGQVAGLIAELPTVQELLDRIAAEAEAALAHLDSLRRAP